MSQEILINHFGLHPERAFFDGMMDRYMVGGLVYSIVGVSNMEQETLVELYKLTEHLKGQGTGMFHLCPEQMREDFWLWKKIKDYVVLRNESIDHRLNHKLGRKLSKFHFRGRTFEEKVEKINRMGQWKKSVGKTASPVGKSLLSSHSGPAC